MKQVAFFDMLAELDGGDGVSRDQVFELIDRLMYKPVSEAARMGEPLIVRGVQVEDGSSYVVVMGESSRREYGNFVWQDAAGTAAPLEFLLQMALNQGGDPEQAERFVEYLETPTPRPEDPDRVQAWEQLEQAKRDKATTYREQLAKRPPENVWNEVCSARQIESSINEHFMLCMRDLRQMQPEAARVGHEILTRGTATPMPTETVEIDGERMRVHPVSVEISASIPDLDWNYGSIIYQLTSRDMDEAHLEHLERTAEVFAATLAAILNDRDDTIDGLTLHCDRCGYSCDGILTMIDHEMGCE
jgi:hypothetical protein